MDMHINNWLLSFCDDGRESYEKQTNEKFRHNRS